MKLLTLNCHSWQEENQLDKIKCLAETIKEKSYDVIALQEVSQSISEAGITDNLKKDNFLIVLIEELKRLGETDYDYFWDFSHIGFDIYEEGLAILTKHKILEKFSFFISQSEDTNHWKTRKIVGVKIQINNEIISFYSCHLGWWGDEEEPFKKQVDQLSSFLDKEGQYFLMGDFNSAANVRNEGFDYICSKGHYDTYILAEEKDNGVTVKGKIKGWDDNKHDLRIDYVFTNKRLPVKKSTTIFNGTHKPIISDHFGLEIELS